jgi:glycosyltransferase involved in cell wall biosynthesis
MITNFPIALRARNRPAFLDVTLRSLKASNLPDNKNMIVIDDCSDDKHAIVHLATSDPIILPKPIEWPVGPSWDSCLGKIKNIRGIHGIRGEIEIVQPEKKKGDLGGIFWIINYMMNRYKNSDAIIVFEADCVVRPDWYEAIERSYLACKDLKGPNGNSLGLLTCYDRSGSFSKKSAKYENPSWAWKSVAPKPGGLWGCGGGIGGVMYLVTRGLYEASISAMKDTYNPEKRSGDTALQAQCGVHKFNIAVTAPSYCQHIGYQSVCWPSKGWRYTKNFYGFGFEKFDAQGYAYSDKWII